MSARFELLGSDGAARRARLHLAHGAIDTPAFMPVGTYGTVKAMLPAELSALGARSSWAIPFTCGCARASR